MKIGVVNEVDVSQTLYCVRVYVGDGAGEPDCEKENIYFETKFQAERFLKSLPESTR